MFKKMNIKKIKIVKDWRLNERHYGSLQGLNKLDTVKKFGSDKSTTVEKEFFYTSSEIKLQRFSTSNKR